MHKMAPVKDSKYSRDNSPQAPKVKVFSLLEMTQKLRLTEATEATKIKSVTEWCLHLLETVVLLSKQEIKYRNTALLCLVYCIM